MEGGGKKSDWDEGQESKRLRLDNGGENDKDVFKTFLEENGIVMQRTIQGLLNKMVLLKE